jgi:hypothetical protein
MVRTTELLTCLCVVGVYFLVKKLFVAKVALLSALLLAFDPYYLAHSRFHSSVCLGDQFHALQTLSHRDYFAQPLQGSGLGPRDGSGLLLGPIEIPLNPIIIEGQGDG